MTVIDELPQIKISVRIAGSEVDCTEYDDPDPPRTPASHGVAMHSTSKVIESQNNAEYYIHCEIDNSLGWFEGNSGLGVDVYIDGKYATSELIVQRHLRGQVATKRLEAIEERSEKPGKVLVKSFKFSTITRVEGRLDYLDRDKQAAAHLGEIEVVMYRLVYLGSAGEFSHDFVSPTELGEKALKGKNVSHQTEFSEGREMPARAVSKIKRIDGHRRLARMTFRYMSKCALQIGGIIPRDPSPPAELPTVEGMDPAKIKRLAQERLVEIQGVKRIKREASSEVDNRPRKVYKIDIDGTIDLTEE